MFRRIYRSLVADTTTSISSSVGPTGTKMAKTTTNATALNNSKGSGASKRAPTSGPTAAAASTTTAATMATAFAARLSMKSATAVDNTPTTARDMRDSALNSVRQPIPSVFPSTADTTTTETKAARVNMKPRCGSTLSANANYHHWYIHAYGLPSDFVEEALSGDCRDLNQMMMLQQANPWPQLHNPFTAVSSATAATAVKTDTSSSAAPTDEAPLPAPPTDPATIARHSHNANHAHWFKHQYCLPSWDIGGSLMRSTTVEGAAARAALADAAAVAHVQVSQQSHHHKGNATTSCNASSPQQQSVSMSSDDRNNIAFSMEVQRAALDTTETSKLFNLH